MLYVAYMDRRPYWRFPDRKEGEALNYASAAQTTDLGPTFSQYGEEYADPRLIEGSVDDRQSLDSLEDQRFTYDNYTFRLQNADGELEIDRIEIVSCICGHFVYTCRPSLRKGRLDRDSNLQVSQSSIGEVLNV